MEYLLYGVKNLKGEIITMSNIGMLYGVGVGPGDKELLTIKAVNIIKKCQVIIVPSALEGGQSTALETAADYIDQDKEVIIKHFPMGGNQEKVKIYEAFKLIEEKINQGKDVAFLTIGDPFIYSTYIYLLEHMVKSKYSVATVPGITSFCAAASLSNTPVVIGDEPLLILPSTKINTIKDEKYIVIMKIGKRIKEVIDFLEEKDYSYVYVKRAGRQGEKILRNKEEIVANEDYMSLIIARKI